MKKPKKAAAKAADKKKSATAKKAVAPARASSKAKAAPAKKPAGTTRAPSKAKAAPAKKPAGATHASSKAKAAPAKAAPAKAGPAPASAKPAKEAPAAKTKTAAAATQASSKAKAAPVVESIPALADVKRPAKPFFMEVKPGVERVIKRGDKTAASQAIDLQARRKGPTAEETPEELAERIERELQSQSFLRRTPMRRQMCTKCGINAVVPRFTIDRELGYCESCAEILRLGETKEAKRMEFNLAAKKEGDEEGGAGSAPAEESEDEPVPEDLDD